MELHITIELKGDAFDQHPIAELEAVMARLTRSITNAAPWEDRDSGSTYDTNGQTVARWEVTE